jgi:serine/threonine protein kinase
VYKFKRNTNENKNNKTGNSNVSSKFAGIEDLNNSHYQDKNKNDTTASLKAPLNTLTMDNSKNIQNQEEKQKADSVSSYNFNTSLSESNRDEILISLYQEQNILSLKHKYINKIYTFNPNQASYYIYVSEYMPYRDLGYLFQNKNLLKLNNTGPIAWSDSLLKYLATQMISLLKYLSDNKIVHGNIKPSHFLINSQFQLKLTDFACSQVILNDLFYLYGNKFKVDPAFQPLEYFRKDKCVDHREAEKIDLFACGCVLYYLATGEALFKEVNLAKQKLNEDPHIVTKFMLQRFKLLPEKLRERNEGLIDMLESKLIV